jgi:16S rRNA (guanine966-N2)-methyltransferase
VRIIGGLYKRSKLSVPKLEGLRPTPDRVRETLFNWLGQDLSGWRCLDAFAGTGALGLECASRSAALVVMVEQSAQLVAALQRHTERLGCADRVQVRKGDGLHALATAKATFELVLLDPPFDATWGQQALAAGAQAAAPGAWVYWESRTALGSASAEALNLRIHRHLKAGQVHAHLLQRV